MPLKYPDKEISSIGEYIKALKETAQDGLVWFRGQSNIGWPLLPNIARPHDHNPDGLMSQEIPAIKRFKQNADAFLNRVPHDDWEWIFLMQHHRGLTRLLDWSESPLVALYFSLTENSDDTDGVVWCLDPMKLNEHSGHKRKMASDVLAFGIDDALDNYLPDRVGLDQGADMSPIAAIGPRNSRRMVAQSGTFTIMHSQRKAVEDVSDCTHIWRLVIPSAKKADIRNELKLLGFNEFLLFPDLETLAIHTREILI